VISRDQVTRAVKLGVDFDKEGLMNEIGAARPIKINQYLSADLFRPIIVGLSLSADLYPVTLFRPVFWPIGFFREDRTEH
jgi:hypothetical protein